MDITAPRWVLDIRRHMGLTCLTCLSVGCPSDAGRLPRIVGILDLASKELYISYFTGDFRQECCPSACHSRTYQGCVDQLLSLSINLLIILVDLFISKVCKMSEKWGKCSSKPKTMSSNITKYSHLGSYFILKLVNRWSKYFIYNRSMNRCSPVTCEWRAFLTIKSVVELNSEVPEVKMPLILCI